MNFEDFKKLSEEEQLAAYTQMQTDNDTLINLKAELASYAADNKTYVEDNKRLVDELTKTKEMNFSLARKLDLGTKKTDAETLLHNMFK